MTHLRAFTTPGKVHPISAVDRAVNRIAAERRAGNEPRRGWIARIFRRNAK